MMQPVWAVACYGWAVEDKVFAPQGPDALSCITPRCVQLSKGHRTDGGSVAGGHLTLAHAASRSLTLPLDARDTVAESLVLTQSAPRLAWTLLEPHGLLDNCCLHSARVPALPGPARSDRRALQAAPRFAIRMVPCRKRHRREEGSS